MPRSLGRTRLRKLLSPKEGSRPSRTLPAPQIVWRLLRERGMSSNRVGLDHLLKESLVGLGKSEDANVHNGDGYQPQKDWENNFWVTGKTGSPEYNYGCDHDVHGWADP